MRADWINLTGAETSPNIAEIYVMDDHVKLVLEIYVRDLETFEELIPDEWLKSKSVTRPSQTERLKRFADSTIQFIVDDGQNLPAQLKLFEPRMRKDRKSPFAGMINPYTRTRVPEAPKDKRVAYAEIVYSFQGKPKRLTIVPPRDKDGRAKVTIGFIAYHKSVPVIDFRYLGAPATLRLNWDDPWYSKFDNPNLKRHHKSALMSFLYVEPYEVRHEILTRVRDLDNWMDLGLKGNEYIEIDELEPLKERIGEFLLGKNPVKVDGKALKPILDRTNYVKVALTGIQLIEQPERLEISTAIVGVIIIYLTDGMPKEVTTDWELFTDQIQRVPATSIDPAGPLLSYVEPEDNVHTWKNFLKNYTIPNVARVEADDSLTRLRVPIGSVVCVAALIPVVRIFRKNQADGSSIRKPVLAGAGLIVGAGLLYPFAQVSVAKPALIAPVLSDDDAKAVLNNLLKNVYRAFDFREESDVYDKLAISVSGDLLSEVYLQSRKSLAVKRAGGAQAKVKAVEVLETRANKHPDKTLGYNVRAKWTALGTVGHWGHVHTRKNLYDANITMEVVDDAWKITGLELLEEQRVDPYANKASGGKS